MLGKLETRKDLIQAAVESGFHHVGQIVSIIAAAGRDVTRELGEWATEVFEMREAAERVGADREQFERAEADRARARREATERARADRDAIAAEHGLS